MYIIENEKNELVGEPLNNLSKVRRPDGGYTTNAKVDEQLYDEGGNKYFIREVVEETSGSGGMLSEVTGPTYADGKWKRVHKYSAKPTPVDAQGTDPDAKGYDKHYGDYRGPSGELIPGNFENHRLNAYRETGVTIEKMIVALWEKEVEDRKDVADALEVKRQAVKKRFPKPE